MPRRRPGASTQRRLGDAGGDVDLVEIDSLEIASSFQTVLVACSVKQNSAHRFCGSAEEVTTALPGLIMFVVHQSQICLVHKSRRLKGLPRLLISHPGGSKPAEFVVD